MCNGPEVFVVITRLIGAAGLVLGSIAGSAWAAPAPRAAVSLGPVGSAVESDGRLVLAVRLTNVGTEVTRNVVVQAIEVKPLTLTVSTKLPMALGDIAPDGSIVLRAAFDSRNGQREAYRLSVTGQYRRNGVAVSFQVAQLFRPVGAPATEQARRAVVTPQTVDGGTFKALPVTPQTFQVDGEEAAPPPLPSGTGRKGARPSVSATQLGAPAAAAVAAGPRLLRVGLQGPNDPVVFRTNKLLGGPSAFFRPPEPTGATSFAMQSPPLAQDVVFAAGNTNAAFSIDGGGSFTTVDPTTLFDFRDGSGNPIDGGGLCCDQVVQYVPSINRYVWLMLTRPRRVEGRGIAVGPNRMRLAVASPQDIVESGATRWRVFDLTPSTFMWDDGRWFDYPDLSYGNGHLYVSADVIDPNAPDMRTARGRMVARIRLADVRDGSSTPIEFMPPEFADVADHGRLVQHAGDTAFWAGHVTDSRVRVFSWPESASAASQHDVDIYPWSAADYSSPDPDGRNVLPLNQHGGIVAGTRRAGTGAPGDHPQEVWFAWTAGRDGSFPQPYVDVLRVDAETFTYISELPVWNPAYFFAYPSLTVNADHEVGMAAAWGGAGSNYGNTAVGILGDFILWITGMSDMSAQLQIPRGTGAVLEPVFGDYLTVRTHWPDTFLYSGYTYRVMRDADNPGQCEPTVAGCRFEVIFTLFGRRSHIAP
jgi:hypothetical protein